MTGLATVAAGDCLYRKLVSGAYIPIRIDCHNGHIPSVLGGHIAFRIYSSNGLIAALPSNGLVRSILREHGCFDGVRVANGQDTFRFVQNNLLNLGGNSDLGACFDDAAGGGYFGFAVINSDDSVAVQSGNGFIIYAKSHIVFCRIGGDKCIIDGCAALPVGLQVNVIHPDSH